MESNLIQILINGGLASVALVSLYVLYKINGNHLHHTEIANRRFADSLDKLSEAIILLANKSKK